MDGDGSTIATADLSKTAKINHHEKRRSADQRAWTLARSTRALPGVTTSSAFRACSICAHGAPRNARASSKNIAGSINFALSLAIICAPPAGDVVFVAVLANERQTSDRGQKSGENIVAGPFNIKPLETPVLSAA